MQRRDFLKLASSAWLLTQMPAAFAETATPNTSANAWRKYRLTYQIDLLESGDDAHLWLPLPDSIEGYQQVSTPIWSGAADTLEFSRDDDVPAFYAHWETDGPRRVTVSMDVATRNRSTDLGSTAPAREPETALEHCLRPVAGMPTDGIVRETALAATKGKDAPLAKARAIYDWVVDNTFRDPKVQGCGRGDIKAMLETGNLGGKCADINSLFVGLCRAVGIPAREVYGIRVGESSQFKSLGRSGDVSRAQHCRAEFYLPEAGWIPVDAADVRKAVLEEKLALDDPRIVALRERLFGNWEMNWVAFNHERDIALSQRHKVGFFMYPCAEVAGKPYDSLKPENFAYRIEANAITA